MGSSGSKVEPGTVLLHAGLAGRARKTPTFSPFVLKLETFLRFTSIPYQFTTKKGASKKGRVPWIEHNGQTVADSYFIIKYLNKTFNVDLNKNLSDAEKAIATAFRIMVEDSLLYVNPLVQFVWQDRSYIKYALQVPAPLTFIIKSTAKKRVAGQGIGQHEREEVVELVDQQLSAISTQLGNKPYLMGSEPTDVDATVFGLLAQFRWSMRPDMFPRKLIEEKYKNIDSYLERIKTTYYPDWNELVTDPVKEQ